MLSSIKVTEVKVLKFYWLTWRFLSETMDSLKWMSHTLHLPHTHWENISHSEKKYNTKNWAGAKQNSCTQQRLICAVRFESLLGAQSVAMDSQLLQAEKQKLWPDSVNDLSCNWAHSVILFCKWKKWHPLLLLVVMEIAFYVASKNVQSYQKSVCDKSLYNHFCSAASLRSGQTVKTQIRLLLKE